MKRDDVVGSSFEESVEDDPRPAAAAAALRKVLALPQLQADAKQLLYLQQALVPYAASLVDNLAELDDKTAASLEELNSDYYQCLDEYQLVRATSNDVVADEKMELTESLRRLEMLGAKLDYELTALHSRVQEVEDGVGDFEKSVLDIEAKVKDLTADHRSRTSSNWFVSLLNFIGR